MIQSSSAPILAESGEWHVAGKWFRDKHQRKVILNGVTYGPFKPNSRGEPWPEDEQLHADLAHMAVLGFNTVRVYEPPTESLLIACRERQLRLFVGIPWPQHVDFMAQKSIRENAENHVREIIRRLRHEPCIAAFIVGNEIEKTLVRWMQPEPVRNFIEKLIAIAKEEAPEKLASYANYPSTEYLLPRNADFLAYNVFLEQRTRFAAYLQRLQNLAADKPLVITEFGLDVQNHGEIAQAETRQWQRKVCQQKGVAGSFWFSYTDEWYRGGGEVTQWSFGLVTSDRKPRPACAISASSIIEPTDVYTPRFSVIVCTRNGSSTLRSCLEALARQTYANHEVLVIDDGSTDTTPEIARSFDFVHYHRQDHAGLSAARNHGMKAATGDVLAYTDDDCIPDEEWLCHLSTAFDAPEWVAAGGPNIPPPSRNNTEACVAAAPGAPSHVLLNDEKAEHLPGCNLAIRKNALEAIGGFLEEFATAGDDVDVCWRLQARGGKLRFVPAAVVWHHRRFTVTAYLRQQSGYGHAEAMLIAHYPQRFSWFSGAHWRGAVYGDEGQLHKLEQEFIHFGTYGLAPFQCIYASGYISPWQRFSGLPWLMITMITFSFGLLSMRLLLIPEFMLALSLVASMQRAIFRNFILRNPTWRQKTLLFFLCFAQPVVRDWARLKGMMLLQAWPGGGFTWPWPKLPHRHFKPDSNWSHETFWNEKGITRDALLPIMKQLAPDHGLQWHNTGEDSLCDAELITKQGDRYGLVSVTEYHEGLKRLTRFAYGGYSKNGFALSIQYSIFIGLSLVCLFISKAVCGVFILAIMLLYSLHLSRKIKAGNQIRDLLYASTNLASITQKHRVSTSPHLDKS